MGSKREEGGKGDGNNWSLSPLESYPQMWTGDIRLRADKGSRILPTRRPLARLVII